MTVSAVWVGNPFFHAALGEMDWRVHWLDPPADKVLTWDELTASAGFTPEVVVVADKSRPPFVAGIESFPCLTVFYAVDTHIHSWYPVYAQAFDACLVSLRDHLPLFHGRLDKSMVRWSPPYARTVDELRQPRPGEETWDALFVGTVDPQINPERQAFFDQLAPLVSGLHVTSGNFYDLFPRATLVLNHTAAGDLNFRFFEALACGSCLVTPRVGHGFSDLFVPGRDLFVYNQDDIAGLARIINGLLQVPDRCRNVGRQGLATVKAAHTPRYRAEAFAAFVRDAFRTGQARDGIERRLRDAKKIHADWLRLIYLLHAETVGNEVLQTAYLRAAKG